MCVLFTHIYIHILYIHSDYSIYDLPACTTECVCIHSSLEVSQLREGEQAENLLGKAPKVRVSCKFSDRLRLSVGMICMAWWILVDHVFPCPAGLCGRRSGILPMAGSSMHTVPYKNWSGRCGGGLEARNGPVWTHGVCVHCRDPQTVPIPLTLLVSESFAVNVGKSSRRMDR